MYSTNNNSPLILNSVLCYLNYTTISKWGQLTSNIKFYLAMI